MGFETALMKFRHELVKEFGVQDGLVKIALEPELFDRVVQELHSDPASPSKFHFRFSSVGELIVQGVQILARRKDNF